MPDGFVCYLVWNILPGIRLGDKRDRRPLFWTLPRSERDDIRGAFEYTHKQLKELGNTPLLFGLTHLVWNPERKEVYVAYTGLLALANNVTTDMSSGSTITPKWEKVIRGVIGLFCSRDSQRFLASLGTNLFLTIEI